MVCDQCGSVCQGRFCKTCGKNRHRGAFQTDGGADAGATDALVYECTVCDTEYIAESSSAECPNCSKTACRFVRHPSTDDGGLRRAEP